MHLFSKALPEAQDAFRRAGAKKTIIFVIVYWFLTFEVAGFQARGCCRMCLTKQRSPDNAAAKCNLVSIFQVAADRYAAGNDTDLQWKILDPFVDIESSSVPFHCGAQGEDNFPDLRFAAVETRNEGFDFQVGGPYAVNRRNHASEHMIHTDVLSGVFDGHYIARVFNNTDDRALAFMAGADMANLCV